MEHDTTATNGGRTVTVQGRQFHAMTAMPAEAFSDFGDLLLDMASGTFARAAYARVTDIIRRSLKPDARDAWDAFLEEDRDPPIAIADLIEAADQLSASATGRPSQPPTPSGNGDERTETASTVISGSPAEAASTISPSGLA